MTQETIVDETSVTEVSQETPETLLAKLQETNKDLTTKVKEFEDNWKNSERLKTKREQEVQRLTELVERNESNENMLKALVAVVAQQKGTTEDEITGEVKAKQPDLLEQFKKIQEEADEKKKKVEVARLQADIQSRVSSYQERTEKLGLKSTDRNYKTIKALVIAGEYDEADELIKEFEAKTNETVKEEKKEVPEDVEKKALELLKSRGLLKDGLINPAGSGIYALSQVEKMTVRELSDFQKKHGGKSIMQLMAEGVVKEK